jgi:hypothetical protein
MRGIGIRSVNSPHTPFWNSKLTSLAIWKEEEYKLLSLFDPAYKPTNGLAYLCAFRNVHPNLTFIFDDHQRGLEGVLYRAVFNCKG